MKFFKWEVPPRKKEKEEKHLGLKNKERNLGVAAGILVASLATNSKVEKMPTDFDAVTGAEKAKVEQKAPAERIKKERKKEQAKVEKNWVLPGEKVPGIEPTPERHPWDGFNAAKEMLEAEIENGSIEDLMDYYEDMEQHLEKKYGAFFEGQDQGVNTDYDYESFCKLAKYLDRIYEKIRKGNLSVEELNKIRDRANAFNGSPEETRKYPGSFFFSLDALMAEHGNNPEAET